MGGGGGHTATSRGGCRGEETKRLAVWKRRRKMQGNGLPAGNQPRLSVSVDGRLRPTIGLLIKRYWILGTLRSIWRELCAASLLSGIQFSEADFKAV